MTPTPIVRCVCGREHAVAESANVLCKCGVSLRIIDRPGNNVQPWATAPDGYDLTRMMHNRPKIVRWVTEAENATR
jgi:hypothetical protein